ncbi:MAG: alpha/beta hydrolase [Actinomycetota bacterium]|nr:alpha/beta hydrolase [Actinomycetota bacterium]
MPYAHNGGARIYWETEGDGPPLLLIMGLGYSMVMWHRLRPVLAERFSVIVFDNRGVGNSDVPEPPYSIPEMTSDAVAVLDAARVDEAHVLGVSMGSVIAQELALTYPERVRSLVLACTACGGPDAVPAEPEVVDTLVARAQMTPEEGVRVMVPFIYDPATPRDRIEDDIALRLKHYPTTQGYLGQLQAVVGYETYQRLDTIAIPTLVIHGESDRLVPHGNGADVARRIRGARFVSLANASHIFFTDQLEASVRVILDFLHEVADVPEDAEMAEVTQ